MNAIGYSFAEALVSLRRSGRSAAMSMGTIAIAFLTLGGFLLVSANLQSLVERWASSAELSVYLRDDMDDASRQALLDELSAHDAVAEVEYVSKDMALDRFRRDFPELADVAASADNPFPPSIEVRLHTDPASSGAAEAMATALAEREAVVDVRYDRQWLSRLMAIIVSIRLAGMTAAAVLVLGAAFTVAAVVRLSLQARREEVDIMHLVGAPFAFIRGPSIAEGTILGGTGAVLSLVLLWALFAVTQEQLAMALAEWGSVGALRFLGVRAAALLVASGLVVGGLAGLVASRAAP
ncbi:MAG TPA: ABC transporter permease [Vicinamibacterales bacterium]|nr:ABC transporter permease [Vicinamibacterales bacterium]